VSDQDTQVIVDTAVRAAEPDALSDDTRLYSLVVPPGSSHVIVDVEKLLAPHKPGPARKLGKVELTTPASLTQYLNAHKGDGTEVYADWRARKAVAVLNDHGERAGWGDHRATLTLMATPEWTRWTALDGKYMSQGEFAEHIIDTTADIVSPDAADLLEMAETFSAAKSVEFKSGHRLKDGQRQLLYVETINASAGQAGNVTIPDSILLHLAPFDGADAVEMGARVRYRIDAGSLRIGYVLDRPDLVLRTAFAAVVAGVEEQTGITALWGTPRS
jgi:uncharacterized protein YfdQ (DUF2303 family)